MSLPCKLTPSGLPWGDLWEHYAVGGGWNTGFYLPITGADTDFKLYADVDGFYRTGGNVAPQWLADSTPPGPKDSAGGYSAAQLLCVPRVAHAGLYPAAPFTVTLITPTGSYHYGVLTGSTQVGAVNAKYTLTNTSFQISYSIFLDNLKRRQVKNSQPTMRDFSLLNSDEYIMLGLLASVNANGSLNVSPCGGATRVYEVKIWKNGAQVYHFLPCEQGLRCVITGYLLRPNVKPTDAPF